jgi:hypothetical protein
MGSSIMRGLGTGLAVGAGAVAAEEIGRRIFSHDAAANAGNAGLSGVGIPDSFDRDVNQDMGGNDFGIADNGSWDDGGGNVAGGDDFGAVGGDWDNS